MRHQRPNSLGQQLSWDQGRAEKTSLKEPNLLKPLRRQMPTYSYEILSPKLTRISTEKKGPPPRDSNPRNHLSHA